MPTIISLDAIQILHWGWVIATIIGIFILIELFIVLYRLNLILKITQDLLNTFHTFIQIPLTLLSYLVQSYQEITQNNDKQTTEEQK